MSDISKAFTRKLTNEDVVILVSRNSCVNSQCDYDQADKAAAIAVNYHDRLCEQVAKQRTNEAAALLAEIDRQFKEVFE